MTEYHGLFLPEDGVSADDYEPEPIMQIEVTRRDPSGPKRIPRAFAPGEIPNHQALYDLFGGGVYELLARRSNGQTYAKRLITLAGAPKPILALDLEQPSPIATTPHAYQQPPQQQQGGLTESAMFSLLIANMQESQRAMASVMVAAMTAQGSRGESAADTMKTLLPLLAPLMQPHPPAAPSSTPLREVLEVSKLIREEARSQSEARERATPATPDDTAGQIRGIIEAVAPVILMAGQAAAATKVLP